MDVRRGAQEPSKPLSASPLVERFGGSYGASGECRYAVWNPYRAGLIGPGEKWPYQGKFQSCGGEAGTPNWLRAARHLSAPQIRARLAQSHLPPLARPSTATPLGPSAA